MKEIFWIILGMSIFISAILLLKRKKTNKIKYIPVEYSNISIEESELLILINEYRTSIGIKPLKLEKLITELSLEHVDYMIEKNAPSHDFFQSRYEQSGAIEMGEICCYNHHTPKSILNAYLESEPHKKTIEEPYFEWIGISTKNKFNCCIFTKY